jgi:hypothetical protein
MLYYYVVGAVRLFTKEIASFIKNTKDCYIPGEKEYSAAAQMGKLYI